VHGGVLASMAESMTTIATYFAVQGDGSTAQGLANQTSFLRPILSGTIHAVARRRHRGRTTWVWEVEISDDEGRLCALVRMTIAVRPA
jgi:1,4-dihydroxy-2-naphthoyl-CoA hydrolase